MKLGENFEFTENLKQAGLVLGLAGALNACGGETSADGKGANIPAGGELPVTTGGAGGEIVAGGGTGGVEQGGTAGNGGFEQAGAGGEGGVEDKRGALHVTLNELNPADRSVPNVGDIDLACFNFASGENAVAVDSIRISQESIGSLDPESKLYLFENGWRMTDPIYIDETNQEAVFDNLNLEIPANDVKTYCLGGYFHTLGYDNTGTHQFGIDSAADIVSSAKTVNGEFPANGGEIMFGGVGGGTLSIRAHGELADVHSGGKDQRIAEFRIWNSRPDMIIDRIRLQFAGTCDPEGISSVSLFKDGDQYPLESMPNSSPFDQAAFPIDVYQIEGGLNLTEGGDYVCYVLADIESDQDCELITYIEEPVDIGISNSLTGEGNRISEQYDGQMHEIGEGTIAGYSSVMVRHPGENSIEIAYPQRIVDTDLGMPGHGRDNFFCYNVKNNGNETYTLAETNYSFMPNGGAYPDIFSCYNSVEGNLSGSHVTGYDPELSRSWRLYDGIEFAPGEEKEVCLSCIISATAPTMQFQIQLAEDGLSFENAAGQAVDSDQINGLPMDGPRYDVYWTQ